MSQADQILNHLKQNKTLTPFQALAEFGCMRLGSRIHDLRSQGHAIATKMIKSNGKRFAEYRLPA